MMTMTSTSRANKDRRQSKLATGQQKTSQHGDRWINKKKEISGQWHIWQTGLKLVRGYGRSVRSKAHVSAMTYVKGREIHRKASNEDIQKLRNGQAKIDKVHKALKKE